MAAPLWPLTLLVAFDLRMPRRIHFLVLVVAAQLAYMTTVKLCFTLQLAATIWHFIEIARRLDDSLLGVILASQDHLTVQSVLLFQMIKGFQPDMLLSFRLIRILTLLRLWVGRRSISQAVGVSKDEETLPGP